MYVVETNVGMLHNPYSIPLFLRYLSEGQKCVFGSRFFKDGSIYDSNCVEQFCLVEVPSFRICC